MTDEQRAAMVEKMARAICLRATGAELRWTEWHSDAIAFLAIAEPAIRNQCAKVAELFAINKNRIHPDIPFDDLPDQTVTIMHATAQEIAAAIREGK